MQSIPSAVAIDEADLSSRAPLKWSKNPSVTQSSPRHGVTRDYGANDGFLGARPQGDSILPAPMAEIWLKSHVSASSARSCG
jgi:hypothetical protein